MCREQINQGPGGLYEGIDLPKLMLGDRAFHIPINLISQDMGDGKVTGVFQTSQGLPLLGGSQRTHVLILGDVFIRPRLMAACDGFRGRGLAELARSGFIDIDTWLAGDMLLPPSDGVGLGDRP